ECDQRLDIENDRSRPELGDAVQHLLWIVDSFVAGLHAQRPDSNDGNPSSSDSSRATPYQCAELPQTARWSVADHWFTLSGQDQALDRIRSLPGRPARTKSARTRDEPLGLIARHPVTPVGRARVQRHVRADRGANDSWPSWALAPAAA